MKTKTFIETPTNQVVKECTLEEYVKEVIKMYQEAVKEPNKSERLLRIAFCLTLLEDKELLKELEK